MRDRIVPELPPEIPSFGNRFSRWLGRTLLRLIGWKIVGQLPAEKKLILALSPHTSNWDFVTAMFGILAIGIKVSYLMKKEAFFWPVRNLFIWLGGIPIDRNAAEDTVVQIRKWFASNEKVCVGITPEGTRAKVDKWKTGFLRIAHQAEVPVFIGAWDYPNKQIVLDRVWPVSENYIEDAASIREYINSKYQGKHPEKQ